MEAEIHEMMLGCVGCNADISLVYSLWRLGTGKKARESDASKIGTIL